MYFSKIIYQIILFQTYPQSPITNMSRSTVFRKYKPIADYGLLEAQPDLYQQTKPPAVEDVDSELETMSESDDDYTFEGFSSAQGYEDREILSDRELFPPETLYQDEGGNTVFREIQEGCLGRHHGLSKQHTKARQIVFDHVIINNSSPNGNAIWTSKAEPVSIEWSLKLSNIYMSSGAACYLTFALYLDQHPQKYNDSHMTLKYHDIEYTSDGQTNHYKAMRQVEHNIFEPGTNTRWTQIYSKKLLYNVVTHNDYITYNEACNTIITLPLADLQRNYNKQLKDDFNIRADLMGFEDKLYYQIEMHPLNQLQPYADLPEFEWTTTTTVRKYDCMPPLHSTTLS